MKNNAYKSVMDRFFPERPMCKCCGDDIHYSNTCVDINQNQKIKIKGKSFQTIKTVNGIDYHLLVCEDCLLRKFPDIKNLSRTFNVMSEITKFAFDIPDDVFESSRHKYAMTKEHMIEKYGEEEGVKKWDNYCKRQAYTNTFEYKNQTYGISLDEFKEYNMSRAVTLKNLIKKYGEEEGTKKWDNYCKRQAYTKSWEYMVSKYGETKAREINKQKSLTRENFIRKYGEEKGIIQWYKYIDNKNTGCSKISQKFFKELDKYICKYYHSQYYDKGGEKSVICEDNEYHLDYFIPELNICVEFNGACFHGDPHIYNDNDHCFPYDSNITAKQLREKDNKRYQLLEKCLGIKTFVMWESDYNNGITAEEFVKNTLNLNI